MSKNQFDYIILVGYIYPTFFYINKFYKMAIATQLKNFYSDLPARDYHKTSIKIAQVVRYANGLVPYFGAEITRAALSIFEIESSKGRDGINNNYAGIRADIALWDNLDLESATGTCIKIDSGRLTRRFICFDENGYKASLKFLCHKVKQRQIYLYAPEISSPDQLALVYLTRWLAVPAVMAPARAGDISRFLNYYSAAVLAVG